MKILWSHFAIIFWTTAIILFLALLVLSNFGLEADKISKLGYTFIVFAVLGVIFSLIGLTRKTK